MTDKKKIVVIGEVLDGGLTAHTKELLGGARDIADNLNGTVEIVLLGENLNQAVTEAVSYGGDVIYIAQSPLLRDCQGDAWLQILESHVKQSEAEILLLGQTAIGRDLGPRLAQRLGTGIAMDCVEINVDKDNGLLRMTRPVCGGKAMAVMVCRTFPQMATVRSKSMKAIEPDSARTGEVIELKPEIDETSIKVSMVEKISEESDGVSIEDASVVVSGGRGIGGLEGFDMLEDLAKLFNGSVGSSRPPCDIGWITASKQVGLTGKIIRPNLYIAVALSGSSQHMAGCQDSGTIIAINKDPEANIFSYAHYGVVDDYKKILPHLIKSLREKLG